VQKYFS